MSSFEREVCALFVCICLLLVGGAGLRVLDESLPQRVEAEELRVAEVVRYESQVRVFYSNGDSRLAPYPGPQVGDLHSRVKCHGFLSASDWKYPR